MWIALFFSLAVATVPVRVTTPSVVLTEMSVALTCLEAANSDFTLVVIQVSATLSGTVRLLSDWLMACCAGLPWAAAWAIGMAAKAVIRPATSRRLRNE